MRNLGMVRATLLLSLGLSALSGTVLADDIGFKRPAKNCPVPEQIGAQAFTSRVITRTEIHLPPSVETRRPADETIVLQSHEPMPIETTQENIAPFASGQHILTSEEQKQLNTLIKRLTAKKIERVEIIGHADQQTLTPMARQRYGTNNGLSAARTQEVATFLRAASGWETVPMTRRWVGTSDLLSVVSTVTAIIRHSNWRRTKNVSASIVGWKFRYGWRQRRIMPMSARHEKQRKRHCRSASLLMVCRLTRLMRRTVPM